MESVMASTAVQLDPQVSLLLLLLLPTPNGELVRRAGAAGRPMRPPRSPWFGSSRSDVPNPLRTSFVRGLFVLLLLPAISGPACDDQYPLPYSVHGGGCVVGCLRRRAGLCIEDSRPMPTSAADQENPFHRLMHHGPGRPNHYDAIEHYDPEVSHEPIYLEAIPVYGA